MKAAEIRQAHLPLIYNVETLLRVVDPVAGEVVQLLHQQVPALFGHVRSAGVLDQTWSPGVGRGGRENHMRCRDPL